MSRHMKRIVSVALAALFAAPALAQYPARPVRMIVSIPPGGAPDIAAAVRALKDRGIVFVDHGTVQPSDKGALTQVYLGGVTFELVKSAA